ncbi:hypothetical protein EDB80DRAFT_883959 [Ilyonectria destructans]|nr:hypothetical protein EDB80DRAFT_883959 [Ilyonectria destructans]
MKSLESTHAGFALTTGCPGAGKSTWATEVCDAVMEGQPGLKSLLLPVHLDFNTAPQQDDTAPSVNDDTAREMASRVCKIVRVAPFNNTTFHRLAGEDPGMFTEIKANMFNVGNFPGWGCLIDPSFIDPTSTQCDHCTKSLCNCITISIRPEKPKMTPAGDIEAGVTATALYNKRDIIREPGKVHALPESRRGRRLKTSNASRWTTSKYTRRCLGGREEFEPRPRSSSQISAMHLNRPTVVLTPSSSTGI